jgi:hypothetical protein
MMLERAPPNKIDDWPNDPVAYARVSNAVGEVLAKFRPPGSPEPRNPETAVYADQAVMLVKQMIEGPKGTRPEGRSASLEAIAGEAMTLLGPSLVDRLKGVAP